MIPLHFYPALFTIFFGAIVFLLAISHVRRISEIAKYVEDQCWVKVEKSFEVEFAHGPEKLLRGAEFKIIRRSRDAIICQDFDSGKMLFVRQNKFLDGLEQGRLKCFDRRL